MKSDRNSGSGALMNLFRAAYLENQDGLLQMKDVRPFLNSYITARIVRKGEDIIRPTHMLSSINLVVRGKVYFIRTSPRGDTNMLAATAAPMFIGVTQLLSSDKEFYSHILAAEQCLILDIDCRYFLNGIRENGEAGIVVMSNLSRIIERNHERMDRMVFLNSTDNLVAYIFRKWLESNEKNSLLLIKERHTVIATDMGVSVRTLYRSINKLKEENLITVRKGGVLEFTSEQLEIIKRRHEDL